MMPTFEIISATHYVSAANGASEDLNKAPQEWSKVAEDLTKALQLFIYYPWQGTLCFFILPFCIRILSICDKGAPEHTFGKHSKWGHHILRHVLQLVQYQWNSIVPSIYASPHCKRVEEKKDTFMYQTLDHKFRCCHWKCRHMSQYLLDTALITPHI